MLLQSKLREYAPCTSVKATRFLNYVAIMHAHIYSSLRGNACALKNTYSADTIGRHILRRPLLKSDKKVNEHLNVTVPSTTKSLRHNPRRALPPSQTRVNTESFDDLCPQPLAARRSQIATTLEIPKR
ncbi:hypothetical protein PUN28_001898 [Cardiocondyla obscurior]|uniref:Uncharacterized protein n=1 Tax=Cardiocondyla obscurior TaxID=286306 RepID=A0AAW2GRU0_9HYME